MQTDIKISTAYARRDDQEAMSRLARPVPADGLVDEISGISEGMKYLFNESGDVMYLLSVNPDMAACFTIAGITEDQGTEIVDEYERGEDEQPAEERLLQAVEAVTGKTLERPH